MLNNLINAVMDIAFRAAAFVALFFYAKREGAKDERNKQTELDNEALQREAQRWSDRPRDWNDTADRLRRAAEKRKGGA